MSLKKLSRRALLKKATRNGSILVASGFIANLNLSWAYELQALPSEQMFNLVRLARDIYPHDRIDDRFYVKAVKKFDDENNKTEIESFFATANEEAAKRFQRGYSDLDEEQRITILTDLQSEPFFQKLRADLITSLYNQPAIWPLFGYEGESFSKGGYLYRGFDDISWL